MKFCFIELLTQLKMPQIQILASNILYSGFRREWEGELYIASVGSRAGGDNRKRARSTQRRVGPKARPTAGAPAPGSPVRASFP